MLELGGNRGHRERGGVRRENRPGRRDRLELGEHLLLHRELFEHRLENQLARAEFRGRGRGRGRDERAEEARLPLLVAAFRDEAGQLRVDRVSGALECARVDVTDNERDFEAAQEQRRELRRHQSRADDSDTSHGARLRVELRAPPPFDEVEGVEGRLRLAARQQLRDRLLLGCVALVDRPAGERAFDQLQGPVRCRRRSVGRVLEVGARPAQDVCERGFGTVPRVGFRRGSGTFS
jgi:hypothetical protein